MSYIGQGLPADVFSGYTVDKFSGTGVASQALTLTKTPFSETAVLVTIDGVVQEPTDDFTVSGTTLTIVGTAPLNSEINVTHIAGAVAVGEASKLDTQGVSDALILDADGDTTISADTDDQIDFKAGGTDVMSMTATGLTINDGTTITTADNTDTLTLVSTDADANVGPNLNLYRNSSSPADNDVLGLVIYNGQNDNNEATIYARQISYIKDASDGTEDGQLTFQTMVAGTTRDRLNITPTEIVLNEESQNLDFRVEGSSNANSFFIDASADRIGINTDSPGAKLHLISTENTYSAKFVNSHASAPYGVQSQFSADAPDSGSDNYFFIAQDYNGSSHTVRFVVYSDGDVKNHDGVFTSISSDERLKSNIVDANSQWDDIKAIKFRNFKKKDDIEAYGADNAKTLLGVVAQEAESVTPKLVKNRDPSPQEIKLNSVFGTLYEDGDTIPEGKEIGDVKEVKEQVKTFKDSILFWKCAKALQEAMAKIETLETKVKALEDA